jgi:hypothetical protein
MAVWKVYNSDRKKVDEKVLLKVGLMEAIQAV